MTIYRLSFDVPTSVNKLYTRTHNGLRLSDAAKAWKQYAVILANQQWEGEPLRGAVTVTYWLYGSRMDFDNGLKLTNDALNGIAWVDDKQITEAHIYIVNRKDNDPHIEIEIKGE